MMKSIYYLLLLPLLLLLLIYRGLVYMFSDYSLCPYKSNPQYIEWNLSANNTAFFDKSLTVQTCAYACVSQCAKWFQLWPEWKEKKHWIFITKFPLSRFAIYLPYLWPCVCACVMIFRSLELAHLYIKNHSQENRRPKPMHSIKKMKRLLMLLLSLTQTGQQWYRRWCWRPKIRPLFSPSFIQSFWFNENICAKIYTHFSCCFAFYQSVSLAICFETHWHCVVFLVPWPLPFYIRLLDFSRRCFCPLALLWMCMWIVYFISEFSISFIHSFIFVCLPNITIRLAIHLLWVCVWCSSIPSKF